MFLGYTLVHAKLRLQSESTSFALGGAWLLLLCTHCLRRDRAGWTYRTLTVKQFSPIAHFAIRPT